MDGDHKCARIVNARSSCAAIRFQKIDIATEFLASGVIRAISAGFHGAAPHLRLARFAVHVSGVEEVDAGIERRINSGQGLFVVDRTPSSANRPQPVPITRL